MPTELQLDALREVANIGCGNAATALSQLVGGRTVQIDVPRVCAVSVEALASVLGGDRSQVLAAVLGMEGELTGQMLLVLPSADAQRLAGLLLGGEVKLPLSEEARSALAEAANILGSACLNAISRLTRLKLLPSPPSLIESSATQVVAQAFKQARTEHALLLMLEARFFTTSQPTVGGQLLVVPDQQSLSPLLARLGV